MYVSPEPMLEQFEVGFKSFVVTTEVALVVVSLALAAVEGSEFLVALRSRCHGLRYIAEAPVRNLGDVTGHRRG